MLAGLAAVGAGLIHLASAIGSPPAVAAVVAVIGVAELGWGVIAVAGRGIPLPNAARVGALVPVVLWVLVLLVAGPAQLGPFTSALRLAPMLAASALDLVVVACVAVVGRRAATRRSPSRGPAGGRGAVIALALCGAAIAVLTAAALGATEVGDQARTGTGFFAPHQH
ncbi:hypothetical protein GCM10009840_08220 [Pseudolysinimonas kribbensis]|uniref:Uncharacterized protein n=2 Tax=Pseudolysinimonas kribbensis TaxID=433641 RepID=A0ABQ6K705_9MICO|nr:hypothetical protein [Pseudolysinimonas kribbensis]GMA95214.1 hypothetical protein GCM10025881_20380 [Pseudolysinimonas kribbensis]